MLVMLCIDRFFSSSIIMKTQVLQKRNDTGTPQNNVDVLKTYAIRTLVMAVSPVQHTESHMIDTQSTKLHNITLVGLRKRTGIV